MERMSLAIFATTRSISRSISRYFSPPALQRFWRLRRSPISWSLTLICWKTSRLRVMRSVALASSGSSGSLATSSRRMPLSFCASSLSRSSSRSTTGVLAQRLVDQPLALLDPLGDLHLALAVEQRHGAHLAQVHAHRVVGLLVDGEAEVGGLVVLLVEVAGPRLQLVAVLVALGPVDDVDAEVGEADVDLVELVGEADHLLRQHLVDLVVEQVALVLAQLDELPDRGVLVVHCYQACDGQSDLLFLPAPTERCPRRAARRRARSSPPRRAGGGSARLSLSTGLPGAPRRPARAASLISRDSSRRRFWCQRRSSLEMESGCPASSEATESSSKIRAMRSTAASSPLSSARTDCTSGAPPRLPYRAQKAR